MPREVMAAWALPPEPVCYSAGAVADFAASLDLHSHATSDPMEGESPRCSYEKLCALALPAGTGAEGSGDGEQFCLERVVINELVSTPPSSGPRSWSAGPVWNGTRYADPRVRASAQFRLVSPERTTSSSRPTLRQRGRSSR